MSNRYLDLDGNKNVSDTYQQIPDAFDGVQTDMDANKSTMDSHIDNANIHVTAAKKAEWDSKAPGITASDLAGHVADMVAHLTEEEHDKLTSIQNGAQVNQNAFSSIGSIGASSPTDTITFEAGTGISITYNAALKKVTFTATGEATPGPHGGSHDEDGSDPIPDLVELKGVVAEQATAIGDAQSAAEAAQATADAAQTAAEAAQTTADAAQATANAAETPEGAQEKADKAQEGSEAYTDAKVGDLATLNTTAKSNAVAAINELFTSASNGKTAVAAAITGKGVAASGSDTFTQLADKIGQISTGIKSASGTVTSSSGTLSFTATDNVNSNMNYITVSGLTFTAGAIVISSTSPISNALSAYSQDSNSGSVGPNYTISGSGAFKVTGNAYINSTGFRLPITGPNISFKWRAYERVN